MTRPRPACVLAAATAMAAAASLPAARAEAQMQPTTPGGAAGAPAIKCEIAEEVHDRTTTLRGFVTGPERADGRYTLRVRKSGPAGTSDVAQSGAFATEPGVRVGLGTVSLGLERTGRYDAVLTLTLGGGTVECRAAGPATSDL